jgi:hypothetical protein
MRSAVGDACVQCVDAARQRGRAWRLGTTGGDLVDRMALGDPVRMSQQRPRVRGPFTTIGRL